jgi:tetratricopeptide (TPR) repeat protein
MAEAQINLGSVDTQRFDREADLNRSQRQAEALYDAGLKALQKGDFAAADAAFSGAVKRVPDNPDVRFLLGEARYGMKKWDEAAAQYEEAVRRAPDRAQFRIRLGVTYIYQVRLEEAGGQRNALAALDAACAGRCDQDKAIKEGLRLLDSAMDAARAVVRQKANETPAAPAP